MPLDSPTAHAVGCILALLRGSHEQQKAAFGEYLPLHVKS
jgi:hypothetical protein